MRVFRNKAFLHHGFHTELESRQRNGRAVRLRMLLFFRRIELRNAFFIACDLLARVARYVVDLHVLADERAIAMEQLDDLHAVFVTELRLRTWPRHRVRANHRLAVDDSAEVLVARRHASPRIAERALRHAAARVGLAAFAVFCSGVNLLGSVFVEQRRFAPLQRLAMPDELHAMRRVRAIIENQAPAGNDVTRYIADAAVVGRVPGYFPRTGAR